MPTKKCSAAPMSRLLYVAQATDIWIRTMENMLSIANLEAFAKNAEAVAHEKSREYTKHCKRDEMLLTSHADMMRKTSAKIVLLRDGLIPALKIDRDNVQLRMDAVSAMGWIHADFVAMDCGFR